ncbi:hypothetical protein EKO27_g10246 [Xylaria grammica]|uniref:beta-glucosidase n=1 Tax=Xylaria grammica TaxID=363999 RepID=A0A439CRR3_9PEZI|nr:hypothetical protein EKO27_g10246 [Xylaria grammica]
MGFDPVSAKEPKNAVTKTKLGHKVNGIHVSEDPRLLKKVLRGEKGFDGLVMSDWHGIYSTFEPILAGLAFEMPGVTYFRGKLVKQALGSGKLQLKDVDDCVRRVLKLVKKALPLGLPKNAEEQTIDTPNIAVHLRSLSADSIVLLKNTNNVLPFRKNKTTAGIGSNARYAAYYCGGSASLRPYHAISPLGGIKSQTSHVEYALGPPAWKRLPLLSEISRTTDGQRGMRMRFFVEPPIKKNCRLVDEVPVDRLYISLNDYSHPEIQNNLLWAELTGEIVAEETAEYEFSISVAGTAKFFIDGKLVNDNETKQRPGESFFGQGTAEELGVVKLEKDNAYSVLVTFGSLPTMTFRSLVAVPFGAAPSFDIQDLKIAERTGVNNEDEISVTVTVTNITDGVAGAPLKELKAFEKVFLNPSEA